MSFFHDIPLLPEDSILGLPILFEADPRSKKVNLGVGAYRTAEGKPLVLNCVQKAENLLIQKHLNKEYLPIEGDSEFVQATLKLIFGDQNPVIHSKNIFASQSLGGSGGLRVLGEFFTKLVTRAIFLPQPSWPNHKTIFERSGFTVGSYPYFNYKTNLIDFPGMCEAIKNLPKGCVILLHAACHNPTGADPSLKEWEELSHLIKQREIIPFFDFAYQGFGDNLEMDARAVRLFQKEGHEMAVAYSYSKNMGLYGERVGLLTILGSDSEIISPISSQIKTLIRGNYSTPPLHGARIASTVLNSPELTFEWNIELAKMCARVKEMRATLAALLQAKMPTRNYSFIEEQKGLFSFIGLTNCQVERLIEEKGIYIPSSGRINLAGLHSGNIEYTAESLISVMQS